MFDRYRRTIEETPDLNVIPVMNLFMVLIPFLLLGAAFYQIGVIPTSIPSHNPEESDVPQTPTTVLVNLVIRPDEMRLTCASTSLSEADLADLADTFPNQGKEQDVKALQQHLLMLKERYPKSTTLTVIPHDGLKYQELVYVLDATRERDSGRRTAKNEIVYDELFPVTIFSRLVTDDPDAAEGG